MASLHSEALAACGLSVDGALSDRDLAILLLDRLTSGAGDVARPRWARLAGHLPHGSGVRQALLRVAGIDPHEVRGWDQRGECPMCGEEDRHE